MESNSFYDIHFHAMDLSHANITAFINRLLDGTKKDDIKKLLKEEVGCLKWLLPFVPYSLIASKLYNMVVTLKSGSGIDKINKIRNLLTYMESSIEYDFLIVEHFLKNKNPNIVNENNELVVDGHTYKKMILCPLIIDFGYKNIFNKNIFYNIPPQKPITQQIKDLMNSIYTYYSKEIIINQNNNLTKFDAKPSTTPKENKLFEIYPFMGINPDNYSFADVQAMLEKYFKNFTNTETGAERHQRLYDKMGNFKGDLNNAEDCADIFAGIKLYPPLGFDPWPENNEKVKLIYETCVEKNIPLTTHCSTGGFVACPDAEKFTNPEKQWAKVLDAYPKLKLNFAHLGRENEDWFETILDHITVYDNVYTDFSCNTEGDACYKNLELQMNANQPILAKKVLFGSDFMINMLWFDSYNQYLGDFVKSPYLIGKKDILCNKNSEKFLFG